MPPVESVALYVSLKSTLWKRYYLTQPCLINILFAGLSDLFYKFLKAFEYLQAILYAGVEHETFPRTSFTFDIFKTKKYFVIPYHFFVDTPLTVWSFGNESWQSPSSSNVQPKREPGRIIEFKMLSKSMLNTGEC